MNHRPKPTNVTDASAERAPLEDDGPSRTDAGGLVGVLRPVVVALLIGLIFVSVYLAAFHAPRPDHLPIAVVGTSQRVHSLATALAHELPSGFAVVRLPDSAAARIAIEHRQVYGAVLVRPDADRLLYAGANGLAVTSLLSDTVAAAGHAEGRSVTASDILPAVPGDTRGLSIFYAAFGLVLAGFLFGGVTYQMAPRLELRQRLISLAVFGLLGGVLITLIAKAFGALPGPFAGLAGVIALMAIAAAAASMTFVRLLGSAGVSFGSVVLLVLGNSTSGGSLPRDFLPTWLHPLSEVLPVGVGVRALDGLAYFDHDGLITAITILGAWIAVAVTALAIRDVLDRRQCVPQASTSQRRAAGRARAASARVRTQSPTAF